jgi:hypothetical protein
MVLSVVCWKWYTWALKQASLWDASKWIPSTKNFLGCCWNHCILGGHDGLVQSVFAHEPFLEGAEHTEVSWRAWSAATLKQVMSCDITCDHARLVSLGGSMKVLECSTVALYFVCDDGPFMLKSCVFRSDESIKGYHGALISTSSPGSSLEMASINWYFSRMFTLGSSFPSPRRIPECVLFALLSCHNLHYTYSVIFW